MRTNLKDAAKIIELCEFLKTQTKGHVPVTRDMLKGFAHALSKQSKEKLSLSESLERISRIYGYASWNAASACLPDASTNQIDDDIFIHTFPFIYGVDNIEDALSITDSCAQERFYESEKIHILTDRCCDISPFWAEKTQKQITMKQVGGQTTPLTRQHIRSCLRANADIIIDQPVLPSNDVLDEIGEARDKGYQVCVTSRIGRYMPGFIMFGEMKGSRVYIPMPYML